VTIEDHEAIRELLHKYCHYVDSADTEGWLSLYVDDGSLDMGMGGPPFAGKEALRTFASARRPGTGLHLSANPIITVDGNEATVVSYVVVIGGNDDPRVRLAGRYEDRMRRAGSQWRFVTRRLDPQMRLAT
jgi:ketosteroid isomerase-like protein